jgi:hypothetical protein
MKKLPVAILVGAAFAWPALRAWSTGAVPFPHGRHVQETSDCAPCHEGVERAENLGRSHLPALETCRSCHEDADLAGWGWTEIAARESRFRGFSHAGHLAAGKDCRDCHGAMVDESLAVPGLGMPGHALCTECHDGVREDDRCEACHSDLREGRLQASLREPEMLKPMSHHPGFLHDHQFAVRLDGSGCAECHRQEDFCSTCHQGENVDFLVHGRNWLFTHALAARKNTQDCSACHRLGDDCAECHAARGIAPGDHYPLSRWRSLTAGGAHAEAARRDISICAACHDEGGAGYESCTFCHRDDGVRGNQSRLNIHPEGFLDDAGEGSWHEDDQASCFGCHARPASPTTRSFCTYCHANPR